LITGLTTALSGFSTVLSGPSDSLDTTTVQPTASAGTTISKTSVNPTAPVRSTDPSTSTKCESEHGGRDVECTGFVDNCEDRRCWGGEGLFKGGLFRRDSCAMRRIVAIAEKSRCLCSRHTPANRRVTAHLGENWQPPLGNPRSRLDRRARVQ